jgi:2-polyprenyl-3-methyl-5-hydroxy-6-metoxy-1,4-benzoquinol methylase
MSVLLDRDNLFPTEKCLRLLFEEKYSSDYGLGWSPALRSRFHYYTPDDVYEAMVGKLIVDNADWADVGCGHSIFPSNAPLARKLADRARTVYGIDPSVNIKSNPFLTDRFQGSLEDYHGRVCFDVVTLRMVVEHVTDPATFVFSLAKISRSNGLVVIYTPNKWSPISLASRILPFRLHHPIKRFLWSTAEEDTFPVAYNLNTRRMLKRHLAAVGFEEILFAYLDDCRTTTAFRLANSMELGLWKGCQLLSKTYPENCLLSVYRKQ